MKNDANSRAGRVARLVAQVERIVAESGNPDGFDAAKWVALWLERPNPALGGKAPGQYLDMRQGMSVVSGLIEKMQSGAYA